MKDSDTKFVYKDYLRKASYQEPHLYAGYYKRLRGSEVVEPREVKSSIKSEYKSEGQSFLKIERDKKMAQRLKALEYLKGKDLSCFGSHFQADKDKKKELVGYLKDKLDMDFKQIASVISVSGAKLTTGGARYIYLN